MHQKGTDLKWTTNVKGVINDIIAGSVETVKFIRLSLNSVDDFLTYDKMHRLMSEVYKTKYFGENEISRSVNSFS